MLRVDVFIDADVLKAIRETAHKAGALMEKAYDRQVKKLRPRILEDLRREPGSPHYPLNWTSERQRRYVMAKLRRENNLPYVRTHVYVESFEVEAQSFSKGGEITVTNSWEGARYVGGDDAQPYHLDTGWPQIADIVVKHEEEVTDIMIDTWYTIVSPEL